MRALTLTQPWAGLVASGIKRIENRNRRAPASLIDQRFAIHASREIDETVYRRIAEIAPDVLQLEQRGDSTIPVIPCKRDWYRFSRTTSAVIGVATLHCAAITDRVLDEPWQDLHGLTDEDWRWFFGPVGYVLRDIVALPTPVPCKGALGFWRLPDDVEHAVKAQIESGLRTIEELIDRSSIGAALRDIKERGIDAHAADLASEMSRRPRR